jgi:hypothetical protein
MHRTRVRRQLPSMALKALALQIGWVAVSAPYRTPLKTSTPSSTKPLTAPAVVLATDLVAASSAGAFCGAGPHEVKAPISPKTIVALTSLNIVLPR